MKNSTKMLLAMVLAMVVLVTASCSNQSGNTASDGSNTAQNDKVKIELWSLETPPNRVEAYENLVEAFEKENEEIDVEVKVVNWGEAYPKLLTAVQNGSQPDIVQTSPDIAITLQQAGALQPVEDVVNSVKEQHGLFDATIKPYTYNGHIWAVPQWSQSIMLYYRADMFEKEGIAPPNTWDELLTAAEKLTKDGVYGIGLPISKHMYADQVFYSFMLTARADVFDAEGKPAINSPETLKTLKFYKELAKYAPKDASNWTWAESEMAMAAGKVAMTPAFGNVLERAYNDAPDIAENIKSIRLPIPEGGQPGTISYPIALAVLSKDEAKLEAAKKFAEFAHTPEVNAAWLNKMAAGCFLPVTKSTSDLPAYQENDVVKAFSGSIANEIEASKDGKFFGFNGDKPVPEIGAITGSNAISEMMQKVVFGEKSPEDAARNAAQQIKEMLQ